MKKCLNKISKIVEVIGGISLIITFFLKAIGFITWEQFWESAILWPVIIFLIGVVLWGISRITP